MFRFLEGRDGNGDEHSLRDAFPGFHCHRFGAVVVILYEELVVWSVIVLIDDADTVRNVKTKFLWRGASCAEEECVSLWNFDNETCWNKRETLGRNRDIRARREIERNGARRLIRREWDGWIEAAEPNGEA